MIHRSEHRRKGRDAKENKVSAHQLADTFRRFVSRSSPSGLSSGLFFSAVFEGVAESCALGGLAAVGFVAFFFTRTPLSDFLASFFAGAGAGFAFGGALLPAVLVAPIGGGLLAAVSRAATALCMWNEYRISSVSSRETSARVHPLPKVFELLALHLLPEALFFALFLQYGV